MNRRSSILAVCLAIELVSALQSTAAAGQSDPEPRAAVSDVTPPELVLFVKASYPAGVPPSERVTVLLEISVGEQGTVAAADIVESAGNAFDQAAREAVKQFRFRPARRGDQPIAVRIRYAYVFEPEARASEPDSAVAARVNARAAEPAKRDSAKTSKASAQTSDSEAEYGATAEIDAPPREVTRHTLDGARLSRIPGARGDALHAIEVLPGVGRTEANNGTLILRGANQGESLTSIQGDPVPFIFHFGGVTSVFSTRLLKRVDVYPSNFSPRYGRVVGGVVEATVREPRMDRLHAMLDLSLLDSSALVEAPLGKNLGLAAAARRSNIDFFFENFVPDDTFSVVAAPLYWDYQLLGSYRFDDKHRLELLAYGSRDQIELFFSEPSQIDPILRGRVGGSVEFHRVQAAVESRWSRDAQQRLQVTLGTTSADQLLGPYRRHFDVPEIYARGEWNLQLSPELRTTFGFDQYTWLLSGGYDGPQPTQEEGTPANEDPTASMRRTTIAETGVSVVYPAFYLEFGYSPSHRLLISPGVRVDYFGLNDTLSVDPRLSTRLLITDSTTLKWGTGIYTQPPEFWQQLSQIANPDIKPYRALHTSVGVEQRFGQELKFGLEAFYKRVLNRIVGTEGSAPPYFVNDGVGRIFGAEALLEARPDADTFVYLAYALTRSERRDRNEAWRLYDKDQTHNLSLTASRQLGRGWELGARFRLVSGNPETPVIDAVYDATSDSYRARYGATNSERTPLFHQLDVRVEKKWTLGAVSIAAYLDVQNAYNAQHREGTSYSFDYSKKEADVGDTIIPNLGLRGEL